MGFYKKVEICNDKLEVLKTFENVEVDIKDNNFLKINYPLDDAFVSIDLKLSSHLSVLMYGAR